MTASYHSLFFPCLYNNEIHKKLTSLLTYSLLVKVSVVDELGIPVKFVGVGEGAEDLQPFDAEAFVNAIFP